jgi:uncharacterized protein involved in exopolysaccharide biosynthesis
MSNQNTIIPNAQEHDELDLVQLYKNILSGKIYILVITLSFAIGSILYSLSLSNLYTASSLLNAVEKSGQSGSSSKSGLGSILSLAGGSTGVSSRSNLAIAIINSREFFEHLITIEGVLPKLVASSDYNPLTGELRYAQDLYDVDSKTWNLSITEAYSEIYRKELRVTQNSKTGFISISFDHISPVFAHAFISLVIDEVNDLARKKDIAEATDAIAYLQSDTVQYSQVDIQASIAQLIESQLKTKMMANVRTNYLLDPIDKPIIPDMKSKPYRAKIVVIGTIIGFIISLIVVIALAYGFKARPKKISS